MNTVMFDWFGVICSKAFWEWAQKNTPEPNTLNSLLQLADRVDAGAITLTEFREAVGALTGQSASTVRRGIAYHVRIDEGVVALIRRIKARHRVGILSNVNSEFLTDILRRENLSPLFDPVIASSALNLMKPDPRIFQRALEFLGCEAANVVFVDDTARHVDAAQELGITSIHFKSVQQLEDDMRTLGVL